MRKLLVSGILAALAVVALASTASADIIYIGQLDYNQSVVEDFTIGQFTVTNQTGANQQPGFPVITQLLFNSDLVLTVDGSDFKNDAVGNGLNQNIDNISWDSDGIFGNSLSATLTGTISPLVINVFGIGIMNVLNGGAIFLENGPLAGNPLVNGDFRKIYINAETKRVPEPVTMSLFGLGLAGVLVRRRMTARG